MLFVPCTALRLCRVTGISCLRHEGFGFGFAPHTALRLCEVIGISCLRHELWIATKHLQCTNVYISKEKNQNCVPH